jgi:UDP-N-acetyl-D-glucosamine/UDP-N-acetyl-D-galactosamine dehydrogenase
MFTYNYIKMNKIYPCVIGLGYVGLPIFVRLKKKFQTIGFDVDPNRVNSLLQKVDKNKEFKKTQLSLDKASIISCNNKDLKNSNFFIITVPTPVHKNYMPNLKPLKEASKLVGKNLKKGDIVFIESTIYPSVTKDICLPIIEKNSDLKNKIDFDIGYSSERINPGDKTHSIENIKKVVSIETNNKKVLKKVLNIYKTIAKKIIISKHIKEAETSKVIENVQRDLNIALMNEIFLICEKLDINFSEVKRLALTKWNFHDYSPGLVGGHCLPVDPYYLAHIAKKNKYSSNVILSGRKVNNGMQNYIINKIIRLTKSKKKNKKILLFGVSYKSNVADVRNSIPMEIWKKMKKKYKNNIYCVDSVIDERIAKKNNILSSVGNLKIDCFIALVNHKDLNLQFKKAKAKNKDIKFINLWK